MASVISRARSTALDDLQHIAGITRECAAALPDRREKSLQHLIQAFLHDAVAQTAVTIACLQILNRVRRWGQTLTPSFFCDRKLSSSASRCLSECFGAIRFAIAPYALCRLVVPVGIS